MICYNVDTLQRPGRLHEVLGAAQGAGGQVALLQGTRWRHTSPDPIHPTQFTTRVGSTSWSVYSWGTSVKDPAAGVAIAVQTRLLQGALVTTGEVLASRIGWIRLKRNNMDLYLVTAYLPPNGTKRGTGMRACEALENWVGTVPVRCIFVIGGDR